MEKMVWKRAAYLLAALVAVGLCVAIFDAFTNWRNDRATTDGTLGDCRYVMMEDLHTGRTFEERICGGQPTVQTKETLPVLAPRFFMEGHPIGLVCDESLDYREQAICRFDENVAALEQAFREVEESAKTNQYLFCQIELSEEKECALDAYLELLSTEQAGWEVATSASCSMEVMYSLKGSMDKYLYLECLTDAMGDRIMNLGALKQRILAAHLLQG